MEPITSIDAALKNYLTTANWDGRQEPALTQSFALLAIAHELNAIKELLIEQSS